jgi:hypothetical protein
MVKMLSSHKYCDASALSSMSPKPTLKLPLLSPTCALSANDKLAEAFEVKSEKTTK